MLEILTIFYVQIKVFKPLEDADNGIFKNVKIAVPVKYLSNSWRSLEIPLINCEIHLELDWTKDCVMSTISYTKLKITNTKMHVPVFNLPNQTKTM